MRLSADHLRKVFAACATAGYTKAAFSHTKYQAEVKVVGGLHYNTFNNSLVLPNVEQMPDVEQIKPEIKPSEIDLTKYAPKK